jgi:RimJ/RimL family protein N-acetyltransferase
MHLRSLGFRTEQFFTRIDGEVIDRGSYLVVRTHSNPNYFWGNLLIFDRPPRQGDYESWTALFHHEFRDPRIYHVTLAWDSPEGIVGDVSEFVERGYLLEKSIVLTSERVHLPQKHNTRIEVRVLSSEAEWDEMVNVQTRGANDLISRASWEGFNRSQAARYRQAERMGMGRWFGAFLDGRLVAGLGIFVVDGIGRYQQVSTDPEFQRRGICGTLVHRTANIALETMGAKKLVMIADEAYHAARIYESVGFVPTEHTVGVYWWDKARTG